VKKRILLKVDRHHPRIDLFLHQALGNVSRARIEKMIDNGRVWLNGRPVLRKNQKVFASDRIEVDPNEPEPIAYRPSQPLTKLFEDRWLLAIDKPAGLAVHPGSGPAQETVLDIFRFHYPQITAMSEKEHPGLVHRLDKDTSGILLLAKDERSMLRLQKQFRLRRVRKTYLALVAGRPHHRYGTIDLPIARHQTHRTRFQVVAEGERPNQRDAVTEFEVVFQFPEIALMKLFPRTGRTHQLRVHLAHTGHPVLGDPLYGPKRKIRFPRLALHAYELKFRHPQTDIEIQIYSPLPGELRCYLAGLFPAK